MIREMGMGTTMRELSGTMVMFYTLIELGYPGIWICQDKWIGMPRVYAFHVTSRPHSHPLNTSPKSYLQGKIN